MAVKEFGANEKQENLDLTERNGTQLGGVRFYRNFGYDKRPLH